MGSRPSITTSFQQNFMDSIEVITYTISSFRIFKVHNMIIEHLPTAMIMSKNEDH